MADTGCDPDIYAYPDAVTTNEPAKFVIIFPQERRSLSQPDVMVEWARYDLNFKTNPKNISMDPAFNILQVFCDSKIEERGRVLRGQALQDICPSWN